MKNNQLKYWFEPYLREFFYNQKKNNHLMFYVNQTVAKALIKRMCITALRARNAPLDIAFMQYGKQTNKCVAMLKEMNFAETKEGQRKSRYLNRHLKEFKAFNEGNETEYVISLHLLTFIQLEIYCSHYLLNDKHGKYELYDEYSVNSLKASYSLCKGEGFKRDSFKYAKKHRLDTISQYYESLTKIFDLWFEILKMNFRFLNYNFKSSLNKGANAYNDYDWYEPEPEDYTELVELYKKHFFLYYIYPEYRIFKITEELENQKEAFQSDLRNICNKNFKLKKNDKNLQKRKDTITHILDIDDSFINQVDNLAHMNTEDYDEVLKAILTDNFDIYPKRIE